MILRIRTLLAEAAECFGISSETYLSLKIRPRTGTQLTLDIPDEVLGILEGDTEKLNPNADQTAKIIAYKQELIDLIGEENHNYILNNERFSSSDTDAILGMARDVSGTPLLAGMALRC